MYYTEWMAKQNEMDTPVVKAARRKDYWYLLEMAGILIDWSPSFYIVNLIYIAFMFTIYSYFVACLLASMSRSEDIYQMCQYINFVGVVTVAMIIKGSVIQKREHLCKLTRIGAAGFFDYGSSFTRTVDIKNFHKTAHTIKKFILIVVPTWLSIIALSVMVSDQVDAVFSNQKTNLTIINGIHQTIPLKMYLYHRINNEFDRWLTILAQAVLSGGTALVIGSGDLIMLFGGQQLIIELKILNMAILDTDKRAAKLYETETGRKPPKDPIEKTKDLKLMGFYKLCLKQTVEHHKVILRYADMYDDLINWPCGAVVVNGSIVVAMSLLCIMQGGGQPSVLVTSFLLMVAEVASIFMVCEVGETITSTSRDLFDSMYAFNWVDCSVTVGKLINIMKSRMRKPIVLTAGSLTPIDRDTFGAMMNTAYSYMNLVRASGAADSL